MRSGRWHLIGAGMGVAVAGAVALLLLAGEYEATQTQAWATAQGPPGHVPGLGMANGPASSVRAAALIAVAAAAVGVLCGWRRLSPAAPLAAGLPLLGLGLLTWLDTWRVSLLLGGSLGPPWSRLVTDQVFGVLGGVLLAAAAIRGRRRSGRAGRTRPAHWPGIAIMLGIIAIPVLWYLVQLTNLTVVDYPGSYWWPFSLTAGGVADLVFVLLIGGIGVLAARRSLRITAVIAGAPLLLTGLCALLAPAVAKDLIDLAGLPQAWRYAFLLDVASGLPLLYGGILVTSGLMPAGRPRKVTKAARPVTAGSAAVS
jgi:hypothetical protein